MELRGIVTVEWRECELKERTKTYLLSHSFQGLVLLKL